LATGRVGAKLASDTRRMTMRYLKALIGLSAVSVALACGADATSPDQSLSGEDKVFADAARTAWAFVQNNTQASTGLAKAHYTFQYVTTWDIASEIAATYAAHELGIIDDANYDGRIRKILGTLSGLPLVDGAAFN